MMKATMLLAMALLGAAAASPFPDAAAADRRVHAFDCRSFGGAPIDRDFSLQNDSPNEDMHVVCAIADDSRLPKAKIRTLNLHGFNNDGEFSGASRVGVRAQMCRSTWHTTGGACTAFQIPGNGALDYTLTMLPVLVSSRDKGWTQEVFADFGYIHLILPKKNENGRASFRGYYISD